MPNHVTTRLVVTGPADDLSLFRTTCLRPVEEGSEEIHLDFNTVIPMPECINGTDSSSVSDYWRFVILGKSDTRLVDSPLEYPWAVQAGLRTRQQFAEYMLKTYPGDLEQAARNIVAEIITGHRSWYEWNIANWGTKWNSYHFRFVSMNEKRLEIMFDTAWSVPKPVLLRLGDMFPRLRFAFASFDEGWNFALEGFVEWDEATIKDVTPTDEFYERVYGFPPERDEEEA